MLASSTTWVSSAWTDSGMSFSSWLSSQRSSASSRTRASVTAPLPPVASRRRDEGERRADAVAQRAREARLEQQERHGGLAADAALLAAHERLEAGAGAQQRQPQRGLQQRLLALGGALDVVVHVQRARGLADAFQQHAQPQEVHRLVVQHRAAHQAQTELRRSPHVAVDLVAVVRRRTPPPPRRRTTGTARWSPARSRARAPRGSNAPPRARRGPSCGSTPGSPAPRSCSAARCRRCRRRRRRSARRTPGTAPTRSSAAASSAAAAARRRTPARA